MTKREEARAALAHALFKYSGLGPLHINDLRPELDALERAVRDEEAEECARTIARSIRRNVYDYDLTATIRARITARKA